MAIKIQTQDAFIPVEIGDITLKFDISDESIKNFRKNATNAQRELNEITINDDDEKALEQCKDVLERGFTMMFDETAFQKIYDISPSVVIVMQYFEQITEGISKELKKRGLTESTKSKANKYLNKKK